MKSFLKYTLYLIPYTLFFSSCDKVENPYLPSTTGGGDTSVIKIRKILVEDYTGHTCPNCPRAARTLEQLCEIYGSKLVTMGVHVNFYAEPCPPHPLPSGAPAGSFATDFRTTAGNNYDAQFDNANIGLPNGMVNRKELGGQKVLYEQKWSEAIDSLKDIPPDAYIEIINTLASGTLTTTIKSQFLNSMNGTYNLVVVLTQDSIVDWQVDDQATPKIVSNYIHRNVLRAAINGGGDGWGELLVANPIASQDFLTKSYSYQLNPLWNDNQCHVVAYIYDAATYEVIQAEEKKIK